MTTINSTVSALCVAIDVFKHRHEVMKGAEREKFEKKRLSTQKQPLQKQTGRWTVSRLHLRIPTQTRSQAAT